MPLSLNVTNLDSAFKSSDLDILTVLNQFLFIQNYNQKVREYHEIRLKLRSFVLCHKVGQSWKPIVHQWNKVCTCNWDCDCIAGVE